VPELRTDTERLVEPPDRDRDRRPETERRDREDCEEVRALRALAEPRLSAAPRVTPVDGEPTTPFADTTGARPQVSQYSSPPPTSSYAPSQPGR